MRAVFRGGGEEGEGGSGHRSRRTARVDHGPSGWPSWCSPCCSSSRCWHPSRSSMVLWIILTPRQAPVLRRGAPPQLPATPVEEPEERPPLVPRPEPTPCSRRGTRHRRRGLHEPGSPPSAANHARQSRRVATTHRSAAATSDGTVGRYATENSVRYCPPPLRHIRICKSWRPSPSFGIFSPCTTDSMLC